MQQEPTDPFMDDGDEMFLENIQVDKLPTPIGLCREDPSSASDATSKFRPLRLIAISKIERVFEGIVDCLLAGDQPLSIWLLPQRSLVRASNPAGNDRKVAHQMSFPGNTPREAWRFTAAIKALELIHEALIDDVVITKRDIYYRDTALFGNQPVVDRLVDDIARTLNMSRASLNIEAAAKGVVAGALSIVRSNGAVCNASDHDQGMLVPHLRHEDTVSVTGARWIIVIEKEAIFHSLIDSVVWSKMANHAIVLTGKGYPDIATRALLSRLATPSADKTSTHIPIYGLFDYDPDGIGILNTYLRGSAALSHENELLTAPSMRWIGLSSRDIFTVHDYCQGHRLPALSIRDRQKASKMLQREVLREDGEKYSWKRELQVMLILNVKAEIEILDVFPGGIGNWLLHHLHL